MPLQMPGARHAEEYGSADGAPIGLSGLLRWLWPVRPAQEAGKAAQEELDTLCQMARIGLWKQAEGADWVDLSEPLRGLLDVPVPRPTMDLALAAAHPEDRTGLERLLRQMRTVLEPAALEVRVQPAQRALRHTRWEIRPHTDPQGRYLGLTAIVQDITEWRVAEERRRQASRMDALGQLAGGLAHDFNNLLHAVVLNLDRLQEAAGRALPAAQAEARIRELVERARGAAERGAELTAQMLAFAGKHPAQRQPLDLVQAVRQAAAAPATSSTLDTRGVQVRFADPPTVASGLLPVMVESDPMLLRASVQTLLARAQAASPDNATVWVALERQHLGAVEAALLGVSPGPYAELSVSDAGEETPPELLPRLFEPFFRPQPDGTDPTAAGVGLAMVHGFARTHGGAVGLESAPGRGTVARLLLPLLPEQALRALQEAASARAGVGEYLANYLDGDLPLAGLRVLLVEDDEEVRETTALLLAEDGAVVTTAEDAPLALALLAGATPFDLLLSDVVLPGGLSGIDVVERAAHLRPGLPALLASGYAAPAQELGRKLPAGVILLRKPYRHADLLDAISATLPQASRRVA